MCSNLSVALCRTEDYGGAIDAANACLEIDSNFAKVCTHTQLINNCDVLHLQWPLHSYVLLFFKFETLIICGHQLITCSCVYNGMCAIPTTTPLYVSAW